MSAGARARWLEGYIDQLVTRDAAGIDPRRDPARLRRYFEAYALNTAGIVSDTTLLRAAGINRKTAVAYEHLLAQLRVESTGGEARPRLYHLREEHGRREVDVLAEIGGRDLLAFEVKASAAPSRDSGKHLAWLRDRLGERFLAGVVFHTGPRVFELDERIVAAPIAALWG